jgi:thymidylate kinase
MIASRRAFLTGLFAALEANGIPYCLLRNYDDLYAAVHTDVDLLIAEDARAGFELHLRRAAEAAGFRQVHSARYVNYSQVFWHPEAGFLRIDYETEVRWRIFPVLTAAEILARRRRHEEFFVPHPEDESVVLFVAALWRQRVSDRYREQLAALYARCPDPDGLRRHLVHAFGKIGHELAGFQARAGSAPIDRPFFRRMRRSLIIRNHLSGAKFGDLARYTFTDLKRLVDRVRRPAGMSLLIVSARPQPRNLEPLKQHIHFLFPAAKTVVRSFDLADQPAPRVRWGLALRVLRLRTLFKGGMFIRNYRVATNADMSRLVRGYARFLFPHRSFVCGEDQSGNLHFAHLASGFMAKLKPGRSTDDEEFSALFVQFLADTLERQAARSAQPNSRRGLFAVLVGLDGAGKTTLARRLCDVTTTGARFNCVRYFHFRPKIFGPMELPLPEFKNHPRKPAPRPNLFRHLLSAARLAKNLLLANLAWWLHGRCIAASGCLVLVDRYFYNYRLDPASVKYAGPPWLLALAEKWFPAPDVVITLRAPAEMLLARKQELSPEEITRQAAVLDQLQFGHARVIAVDASRPADEVARATLDALAGVLERE